MYLHSFNEEMRSRFGCKVYRLALSAGCTCPNRDGTVGSRGCIFCDGAGAFAAHGPISHQLAQAKARVSAKAGSGAYVAYFQDYTNTYAPVETLRRLFTDAMEPEDVVALSVATRPDCLGDEVLDLLRDLRRKKPVWVELGLQTIHPATAEYIRRGYPLEQYDEAVEQLHRIGAEVITHMILGLPGEGAEEMVRTAEYIGRSGAEGIKLHMLHVLRNTDLAEEYGRGVFRTMELEEYISALERCIRRLPRSVVINRLTGDGAKKDLIAPLWSGDKKRVLNAIRASFLRDDLVQGSEL
ncbi:TIGR01212 family radical SAM protein [Dysosmobacter acutus]|uniref:TIGR01212 family radical SAM protein n=1 Tax=Dysosmobacter acutus TaxID=2841504 RepID=UPI001F4C9D75|nr:TIGR01212 family radical SAM protein [Dysosmobacter acutus]